MGPIPSPMELFGRGHQRVDSSRSVHLFLESRREYLLTGDVFSPQRAYEIGIVNRVVPHSDVLDAAFGMAERILRHSPLAAARILDAVTRGLNTTIAEGLQIESEQFARIVETLDIREGLDAWIERRRPSYSGR